jgi:hypothetical protein
MDYAPPRPLPGFVGGTQVQFESGLPSGEEVASTVACFDTAANAQTQYDQWGAITNGCVDASLSPIDAQAFDFGPVAGTDDTKGTFCPADEVPGRKLAASASLYVLTGPVVFSVSFQSHEMDAVTPDVVATITGAAIALAARLAAAS